MCKVVSAQWTVCLTYGQEEQPQHTRRLHELRSTVSSELMSNVPTVNRTNCVGQTVPDCCTDGVLGYRWKIGWKCADKYDTRVLHLKPWS